MTNIAAPPLRVGLFGLGRPGLHLIERFAVSGPFRVVATFADPIVADIVSPFGVRLANSPQELVAAADVDVIWFAEHDAFRNHFTPADVLREKHVIVETPLALTSSAANHAFKAAADHNRLLLVRHPRRSDPDFRQALAVAQDRNHGTIRAAKFVSWSYGLPPRGAARGHGPLPPDASGDPQITKLRFAAHALDQLTTLIGDRPLRVFATGDRNAAGPPSLLAGYSIAIHITFKTGCQAELDIRVDSPTQFQSGWLLTTEQTGYAKGRQFTRTEEGEIFDSPVTAVSDDDGDDDQLELLAQQIRSGLQNRVEEARVRATVALLEAAQHSLESRQVVEL